MFFMKFFGNLYNIYSVIALSTYTGKKKGTVITCTMARVAGTYGFAQPVGATGREEDIFIPGRYLCGALPGDEVRVTLSPNPRREGTREGEVSEVLPGEGTVTGVLEYDGRTLWLRPDFCSKMLLALDEDDPELDGQKAACLPVYRGRDYDEHVFSVQLCFGDAETAAACCAAVLHENRIPTVFPDKVLTAAAVLQKQAGGLSVTQPGYSAVSFPPQETEGRLDLRDEPIFTIDSASTKDIDDAINISAVDGGWQLGVAPTFFQVDGVLYEHCDEFVYTETMRERKQVMEERSDAFVMTAGGIGTFEEFFEILTLKQLGRHAKPIAVLNTGGYYNALQTMLEQAIEQRFMKPECRRLYRFCATPKEVLDYLENAADDPVDPAAMKHLWLHPEK